MLTTQYRAAKIAGVSKQAINKQLKKVPIPQYFIETKTGFMVDTEHPLWKAYLENLRLKQKHGSLQGSKFYTMEEIGKMIGEVTDRVGKTMVAVLNERLDLSREELVDIVLEIEERVKG